MIVIPDKSGFQMVTIFPLLDIHISRHLARVQIKSMNDLFRPTKSRLMYLLIVPNMTRQTYQRLSTANQITSFLTSD